MPEEYELGEWVNVEIGGAPGIPKKTVRMFSFYHVEDALILLSRNQDMKHLRDPKTRAEIARKMKSS